MAFRVDISQNAKRDLDAIVEWVTAREAGIAGTRWIQGLHDAIASLAHLPSRCKLAKETASFPFEIRQLLMATGHWASESFPPSEAML